MLAAVSAVSGCGCVKKVTKVAKVANDARDGDFTVKDEDGEKVTIEADEDGEGGTWTVEGEDGKATWSADEEDGKTVIDSTDEEGVTRTTEIGADTVTSADLGIDFYPGAEVGDGAKMSSNEGTTYATVALTTSDSPEKVGKFYRDKYAAGATVNEMGEVTMIKIGTAGTADSKQIIVAPKDDGGGTEITLVSGAPG